MIDLLDEVDVSKTKVTKKTSTIEVIMTKVVALLLWLTMVSPSTRSGTLSNQRNPQLFFAPVASRLRSVLRSMRSKCRFEEVAVDGAETRGGEEGEERAV